MAISTPAERRAWELLEEADRTARQLTSFREVFTRVLAENSFYQAKLDGCSFPPRSLEEFSQLPLTTKQDLIDSSTAPFAANLTWPAERYVRYHQTSGTSGTPLVVLDTAADWHWWMDTWQYVLDAAEITDSDRALLAFSFGPFIGFWSAHDALIARGTMVVPGGGLGTRSRLELINRSGATVIFSTPTYALYMAEVARQEGIDLRSSPVRIVVVAGEPGGSLPATRERIESAWGAKLIDHSGASEVGPWGYGDAQGAGLWVNEHSFLAETLKMDSNDPVPEGELGELVLTTLGRVGSPLLRYRTGDLVRATRLKTGPRRFLFLEGGVLGRADDMLIIRGVNIFPSSIEQILRGFPEVDEFRMTASRIGGLDQIKIEVEDRAGKPTRIAQALETQLSLKVDVQLVEANSLPRFEGKGRRFIDQRNEDES